VAGLRWHFQDHGDSAEVTLTSGPQPQSNDLRISPLRDKREN
jgi:hypothetical protein